MRCGPPAFPERSLGTGAGLGGAAFKPLLPTPPATGRPRRSLALPRRCQLPIGGAAAVPRPQPPAARRARAASLWVVRRARAPPAMALLLQLLRRLLRYLGWPQHQVRPRGGCLRPESRSGGTSRLQPLGWAEGGREGRFRGRWGGFSALLARSRVCRSTLPARGGTALTQVAKWLFLP